MMVAMTRADAVVPNSLVLQVHDELVFEVPEAEADNAAARVKAAMESVSEFLLVPIVANVGVGSNWSKCK
jgi:DNA polymerase-1